MAHAQSKEQCEQCRFFFARYEEVGMCRRHAPQSDGHPMVMNEYWCGDFEAAQVSSEEA